jgi:hypothetical protein
MPDDRAMLDDALTRARKLVGDLERQKAELSASPGSLPSDKLIKGIAAFENALSSARRMLAALEDAATSTDGPTPHD